MANSLGTLTLDLIAKIGGFTAPLDKAERDAEKFGKKLKQLGDEGSLSVDRLQKSFNTLNIRSSMDIDTEKRKIVAAFDAIKNSGVSSFAEISRAKAAMVTQIKSLDGSLNNTSSAFTGLGSTAIAAIAGISLTTVISQLHQAGMAAESLRGSYSTVFGSMADGKIQLQFVSDEANRLGLDINSVSAAYLKLSAASKGTNLEGQNTKDIFSAVAGAGRALSLSVDQMDGALLAIGQMISKGTVQAEELRGQLGERLPGAFQIASRAMGVTTADLGKMLEQGQVISADFLPKFAAELSKTFTPGQAQLKGLTAETARLATSFTDLKKSVMESGGETLFSGLIQGSSKFLKDMADGIRLFDKIRKDVALYDQNYGKAAPYDKSGLSTVKLDTLLPQSNSLDLSGSFFQNIAPDFGAATSRKDVVDFSAALSRVTPFIEENKKATKETTSEYERNQKAIQDQIKALKFQADTIRMTADAVKLKELADKGALPAQIDLASKALATIDTYKKEQKASEDLLKAEKELTEFYGKEALASVKAYEDMIDRLTPKEDNLAQQTISDLQSLQTNGGTKEQFASAVSQGLTASPSFGDIDPQFGGQSGELDKIAKAESDLEKWKATNDAYLDMLDVSGMTELESLSAFLNSKLGLEKEYASKKNALDQVRIKTESDMILQGQKLALAATGGFADTMLQVTKNFAGENSKSYRAMFAIQKIFAAASIIVNTQIAASAALSQTGSIFSGATMAAIITATGYANAAMVAGMGLMGMSHDGIDSIPKTGTWLLEKGERVTTAETSAKLDRTLDNVSKDSSGGVPIVNLFEDKSKAGTVETRKEDNRNIIDIWVADLMGDGKSQKAMGKKFGLQPIGA